MKMVTVCVNVERHVREVAARPIAEQGLMIGDTVRIVLEQAAVGCGPDFGALAPNPTTVAARHREVIEFATPAEAIAELNRDGSGPGRQGSRRVRSVKRTAQIRRDFKRVKRGAHRCVSKALELVRIGSHAQLGQ